MEEPMDRYIVWLWAEYGGYFILPILILFLFSLFLLSVKQR